MPAHSWTLAGHIASRLRKRADELAPPETDADRVRAYRNDVIAFAREVLGIQPWSKQGLILQAVLLHKRVSVVSGHKVGKSTAYAILALWFYCSFPGARVVITATTDNQVNGIIWREIKRLCRNARVAIPGADKIAIRANTGLTDPTDFSEIRGYTAKEAEAIAGVSGAYVMYLVDEASGVEDFIFEAIEGNRAGGNAWVCLISNPTRADGEFYESHHSKAAGDHNPEGYYALHIDSRESPNVTGEWRELEEWDRKAGEWRKRTEPVPGLASAEWVTEKLREWGPDSALFKIRVAGLFCVAEEAKIFQIALIAAMQSRWPDTAAEGRLYIGVDPAGDGDGGDESGFASRRGLKVLELRARAGLSPEAHIAIVQDMIAAAGPAAGAVAKLPPIVCIDSEGEAGWKVYVKFREHAERTREFEVARIRSSNKAIREPLIYDRIRDELYANLRRWAREGGAIPESAKLEKDLHAPEFKSDISGRLKATPKKDLRILLGRSPDIGDAVLLCTWEPMSARRDEQSATPPAPEHDTYTAGEAFAGGAFDPYSSNPFS